ncbi:hypothetical protein ZIOFF_035609 [Zingiber officinale]|uniref:Uncharacterized protein n=1 Tax=Zingiber officinale TaxID=94328 RepID=A0A8J5G9F9_ZINOF|nr:hypothetical protein ZIOFF_035609 [Zingiber officinale]
MGITQENPVGTGFSFVEEESLLEKSDWEAAANLTALLKKLYHGNAAMQRRTKSSSSWQSYCGRFAVTTALSVLHAIRARQLKLKLEGVALGNNWMSPKDYVIKRGAIHARAHLKPLLGRRSIHVAGYSERKARNLSDRSNDVARSKLRRDGDDQLRARVVSVDDGRWQRTRAAASITGRDGHRHLTD